VQLTNKPRTKPGAFGIIEEPGTKLDVARTVEDFLWQRRSGNPASKVAAH
jgi:hypothetical protein